MTNPLNKAWQAYEPSTDKQASDVVVGISGARRNAAAALAVGGRLVGFCEQERLSRNRGAGLRPGELPREAVAAVLGIGDYSSDEVTAYVTAEEGMLVPAGLPHMPLDHHYCHAATAFLTSPFDSAAVLVCDRHSSPDVSVWLGRDGQLFNQGWPWKGPGFAALFTQCAEVFGLDPGQEHRLEALARLNPGNEAPRLFPLIRYTEAGLWTDPDWKEVVSDWVHKNGPSWELDLGARVAAAFQVALGRALLALISDIRRTLKVTRLCLAGGLFYNTFLNTLIAESAGFDEVFIPPNPGNPGIAAGAALAVGNHGTVNDTRKTVSAFLGPEYDLEDIKATLDNCKLSYEYFSDDEIIATCAQAMASGYLVGWFQGRMEWGHRALGNRSILASPLAPYVLDNLNVFLKHRERHRLYGLSVCEDDLGQHFEGPARSAWMEYEYRIKDPGGFREVLPRGVSTLRVQTVDRAASLFGRLHKAFGELTGTSVLVNTSFNGFEEPIVCSPRDAIRVFYGSGLDLLVLGRFVIRK